MHELRVELGNFLSKLHIYGFNLSPKKWHELLNGCEIGCAEILRTSFFERVFVVLQRALVNGFTCGDNRTFVAQSRSQQPRKTKHERRRRGVDEKCADYRRCHHNERQTAFSWSKRL